MKFIIFVLFIKLVVAVQTSTDRGNSYQNNVADFVQRERIEHESLIRVLTERTFSKLNIVEVVKSVKTEIFSPIESGTVYSNERYNDALCVMEFQHLITALGSFEMWAMSMIDSWGKIPSGLLQGNVREFGNYDQCLATVQQTNVTSSGRIRGQYCTATIFSSDQTSPLAAIAISIGVCMPDTCSPVMTTVNLNTILSQLNFTSQVTHNSCSVDDNIDLTAIDYVAIVTFSIIIGLLVTSTAYDLLIRYNKRTVSPILASFSMYTNGQRLFSCKKSNSPDVMHCLNGIRVLSILWVMFGHTYIIPMESFMNTMTFLNWMGSTLSAVVLNATLAVDTFFVLSGLLVTWSMFKELDRRRSMNIPLMYFHRYLRLTPSLAALLLMFVSLLRYMGNGPMWNTTIDGQIELCNDYWWSTLLYVQNYVNAEGICLTHSWYLSIDMQLFVLSPIVLYPLWRWRNKFIGVIVALILFTVGYIFAVSYTNDLSLNPLTGNYFMTLLKIYLPTHTRMGPYLIGILLGYVLHLQRYNRVKLAPHWIMLGWACSLAVIPAVVFGPIKAFEIGYEEGPLESPMYESLSRNGFALAVSWLIYACVKGYGGPINWFLSLAFWQPLARLSYSIYLLHVIIQTVMASSVKTMSYFSDMRRIHSLWGDIGFTLTFAIFWTLAFESPITILEKYLIGKKPQTDTSKEQFVTEDSPKSQAVLVDNNNENESKVDIDNEMSKQS